MTKIRVLVIDDSVLVRRFLSEAISADGDMEVVGVAANGKIGLAKLPMLNPDVVTLDMVMPDMDGLETLAQIRATYPKLPVVVFSSSNDHLARLRRLDFPLGPTEVVQKPATISASGLPQGARDEMVASLRSVTGRRKPEPRATPPSASGAAPASGARTATTAGAASPAAPRTTPALGVVNVVAIGSSTGGPNALEAVFSKLPASLNVPIVVTQHMPPYFTGLLATRLTNASRIKVVEAQDGEVVTPGNAYLAPGDFHMCFVVDGTSVRVQLNKGAAENSCRPAVDVMFRSVVSVWGGRVLGVVLTGMGQDGLRGAELIRGAGGQIVVQDEATSVVWGMPGFIARAGLADAVVPLEGVEAEIVRRVFPYGADPRRASTSAFIGGSHAA